MIEQESKKQILKSTGILGSVQVVTILIGIIRLKALAVLLGPVGVGIAGIYQTTITLIGSATGFGLSFSGVRDIAAAAATDDENRVAKTVLVLRRWSWFTGLLGMLVTLLFCKTLSRVAFGNESFTQGIAILSIALLLSAVTGGMNALLQGMRKIAAMAKANIISAILGSMGAVGIYYAWGVQGIVPALLLTFFLAQITAWYFARKLKIQNTKLSIEQTYREGLSMAKLGFFTVFAALAGNGIMYLVRAFIVNQEGLDSVGYFIAAWTISSMYTSAIFNAMGTDYYPRLSGVQNDNVATTRLVNEQTEVALLITMPLIIGMISFIELIVRILYSSNFSATSGILNWQLLGDFFKVLSWPMGFVLLAKAKGKLFILTELVWNFLFLTLVYFGWEVFGIKVSGIAFLAAYILNLAIIYFIIKRMIGFKWSSNVLRYIACFLPLLILSFLSSILLKQQYQQYLAGSILTVGTCVYSLTQLNKIIDIDSIMRKFRNSVSPN